MIQIYYLLVFFLSVLFTAIYMVFWRKYYDVHITLVFALIPIVNLGSLLYGFSQSTEASVISLKIMYLGGCFLQLMILFAIFSLCQIRIPKWLHLLFAGISFILYLSVLTIGKHPWFYTGVSMKTTEDGFVLVRHYGIMHSVFYAMIILYYALSISAIVYSFIRRRQVSRKILVLLLLPVNVCIVCYFFGRRIFPEIELSPFAYVFAQICYLFLAYRISLYNVADTAVTTMVHSGNPAFISFDMQYNYLGSNETAKLILPELNHLTVDLSLNRSKSLNELFSPWLDLYRNHPEDLENNRHFIEYDNKIYQFTVSPLKNRDRQFGYELIGTDDTQDRAYINLLNHYNENLEKDVAEKTEHIVEMHNNLVMGMATMVESRDNSTGGHIRRTSEGVRILIDAIRGTGVFPLTDEFCKNLIKAAPMHDLGKIAVDDAILRKPGRFSPEEYEVMKTHAAEGARIVHEILKATDDMPFHQLAENVAHYHHERWDGKGYPDGLREKQIPLEARIMAVADVYDALVSKRIYKEKISFEKADSIILEGMGSQFDPAMKAVYIAARPRLEAYYSGLES